MRILLAAPRVEDLPWAEAEIMAVERMPRLKVTLRIGNVTPADLLHDVVTGQYDGFWFAGHATTRGFLLSNGPLANAEIVPLLRGRFAWAFLNTCESDTTARLIRRETGMAVVATITEVPDQLAYQTGVLFAEVLGRTGDIAAAYEQSRPVDRVYVYEAGEGKVPQNNEDDDLPANETERRQWMVRQINELRYALLGDDRYGINGMVDTVRKIWIWLYVLSVLLAIVALILLYQQFQIYQMIQRLG